MRERAAPLSGALSDWRGRPPCRSSGNPPLAPGIQESPGRRETGSLYSPTLGCSSCGVERDLSSAGDDYIVGEDSQDVLRASLTLLEFLTKHRPGQSLPLACQSEEANSSVWESDTDTLLWRQSDSKQGKALLDLNLLSTSLSMF